MSSQPNQATDNNTEKGFLANLLSGKTPAVRNIEKAYSRAGASNHHTPGVATKLGSQEQPSATESQGLGSAKFADRYSDQRVEVRAPIGTVSGADVGEWCSRRWSGRCLIT